MDRPILFNGDMVRAVLDGRKTQTRRPMKNQPPDPEAVRRLAGDVFSPHLGTDGTWRVAGPVWAVRELLGAEPHWVCPFGRVGDRLWVRETWSAPGAFAEHKTGRVFYRADYADGREPHGQRWRPSIHMPRWASRLTLDVVSVRVERLQDISEADALAEGFASDAPDAPFIVTARDAFRHKWLDLYGHGSWSANPWVWIVAFRKSEVR